MTNSISPNNGANTQRLSETIGLGGTLIGDGIDQIAALTGLDKLLAGDPTLNQLMAKPDTLQRFSPAEGGRHTVRQGESLDSIAKANGTTWQALQSLNNLPNPNLIRPGQSIILPANTGQSYTVRAGDTLSAIASRFGTTAQAIADASGVTNLNRIYAGDTLQIPAGRAPADDAARLQPRANEAAIQPAQNNASPVNGVPAPSAASVRAAEYAESHVLSSSAGKCYRYVKIALQQSGAVSSYLEGVAAKGAGPQLERNGFVNVLNQPGANIRSPYDAPPGAVLVYGAAPGATDKNAKYGHIEIRTANGFASDYFSTNARTGSAANGLSSAEGKTNGRVLIGVYIKPEAGAAIRPAAGADPTSPTSPAGPNDTIARLGSVITIGEGNYESYNTGTKGVKDDRVGHSYLNPPAGTVTNMTINQIIATEGLSGYATNRMFATGKYQTTIGTLKLAKEALGLTGNERYTPALQERVFREFLLDKAGGGKLASFITSGVGTVDSAQFAASKEWASIAVPAGYTNKYGVVSDGTLSYYQKAGQNSANGTATRELRALLVEIDRSR